MEPVRSRPQTMVGHKGISQPNQLKWIQRGGWIGPEVAKPPGYDLAKLLTQYKKTTTS